MISSIVMFFRHLGLWAVARAVEIISAGLILALFLLTSPEPEFTGTSDFFTAWGSISLAVLGKYLSTGFALGAIVLFLLTMSLPLQCAVLTVGLGLLLLGVQDYYDVLDSRLFVFVGMQSVVVGVATYVTTKRATRDKRLTP